MQLSAAFKGRRIPMGAALLVGELRAEVGRAVKAAAA